MCIMRLSLKYGQVSSYTIDMVYILNIGKYYVTQTLLSSESNIPFASRVDFLVYAHINCNS